MPQRASLCVDACCAALATAALMYVVRERRGALGGERCALGGLLLYIRCPAGALNVEELLGDL